MIEKMCTRSVVIDVISKFLSHRISCDEMCDTLDDLKMEIYEKRKVSLYIEDIFLSHLISWVTAIPEQAYTASELEKVVSALKGQASISYSSFVRVLPSMLTDDDRALLKIAHTCVQESSNDELSSASFRLTEEDNRLFWSIYKKYGNQKMEFYRFSTVTEWLSYQIMRLIRIGSAKRAAAGMVSSIDVIKQKLQRYMFMLEGKDEMYIITDGNSVSVI